MGTVYWLLAGILFGSHCNARPFYDDTDFSNARFLEALLYEKTETLKAAISLLSQLNLPLLCQSVAADPDAKFATVADLLHFATVVVQSQENMTASLDDMQEYSTLPTEIPFEKITSVYPKAVTETVSLDIEPATRPAFPNSEMLENDFKPIEELDLKESIKGKLLDNQLVINSHDSINRENGFESQSRLMKNKTKLWQEKQTSPQNTKSSKVQNTSQKQTHRMPSFSTKIPTTETPKTETFPQTTGASTYVTLESENSFTELPGTQRPKRPDQSYYGRSDQQPSQPTSGHSKPGFTTPLHWLIREKWPQMQGDKISREELSREILAQIESDNVTFANHSEENITTNKQESTNATSKPTTTQQKLSTTDNIATKLTTVMKQNKSTSDTHATRVPSPKTMTTSNRKTTTTYEATRNGSLGVTVTKSPSRVTSRKSPYLTTQPAAKSSSQEPKTTETPASKTTHSATNTSEIIRSNETKSNETSEKSSHSKSVRPIFTTINITQILEFTKTASPAQRRTHTFTTRKSKRPGTKITSKTVTMTTTLNQTVLDSINTTAMPINETSATTLTSKPSSQSTTSDHNVSVTKLASRKYSNPENKITTTKSQTRNITKITKKDLPQNLTTSVPTSTQKTTTPPPPPTTTTTTSTQSAKTSAAKSTTGKPKKLTKPKPTTKPVPILKHDSSQENSVKDPQSQKPSLREKIVPVQNSRDSDRSDLGDYGNEITQEETKDYIAPGQNDDSFGFFTCPTIFGFYPDAINCGQFYICSWSIPYHFDCPVGTVWNTELTVCDWPFNVNCGTRPWFGQTAFEKHFLPNQL